MERSYRNTFPTTTSSNARPALRTCVMFARRPTISVARDLPRAKLRDLLLAAFLATLLAAQQVDPKIELSLG